MLKILTILLVTFTLHNVNAETLVIDAKPGRFDISTIGESADMVKISTSIKLKAIDDSFYWPAAAYVGFFEGPDRGESFQFVYFRNNGGRKPFLIASYRVIEGKREKFRNELAKYPLNASINVNLIFNKGVITILLDDQKPITVKTRLTMVTPYVSVSSGIAEFKLNE